MNSFYILCHGGFGNRFNALLAGLYFAKRLNYIPVVVWPQNNWCGAAFSEIFENDFAVHDFNREYFIHASNVIKVMHDDVLQLGPFININGIGSIAKLAEATKNNNIFYFNNLIPSRLVDNTELFFEVLNNLQFRREILDTVNAVIQHNTTGEFYGIHIRKTDFGSRSDFAEHHCIQLVSEQQDRKFFICSDDKETEQKFLRFPNVFAYNKEDYVKPYRDGGWNDSITCQENFTWSFNVNRSSESVISSVVDLLILSRATSIVSPFVGSTFAQVAGQLAVSRINK